MTQIRQFRRYSDAVKKQILEEIRDAKWPSVSAAARAYGIRGSSTIMRWMVQFDCVHLANRVTHVNTASEITEFERLRKELKEVKAALADEVIAHRLDNAVFHHYCIANGDNAEDVKKNIGKFRPIK